MNVMKIALTALFAASVATSTGAALAQDLAPQFAERIPAGVPLRVELDKSYSMKVGTQIQGHLTEPIYLIDHVAVPTNSKVYGLITAKHSVSRQIRTAAMFNGDLTPLKNADVTFNTLETPDGRHFDIQTDATERTATVVRMSAPEQAPRKSLKQKISAAFSWTKRTTVSAFNTPHKMDQAKQALYAQIPLHPQEIWAGTQYDAELTEPVELTGQAAPAPVEAASINELKLTGDLEARLVDPVDSATATPGMPVEAVLVEPLFEDEAASPASTEEAKVSSATETATTDEASTAAFTSAPDSEPVSVSGAHLIRTSASASAPRLIRTSMVTSTPVAASVAAPVATPASASVPTPTHRKLLLPEGTHLIGTVVEAKPAGMFGHNGTLRLTFRKAELPEGDERVVHGRVIAAEGLRNDRLQIDEEGQIKANGSNRFLAPLAVGSLAAVSDSAGAGLLKEAMTGNGLDLLTRVIGTASANAGLISGFGYYEVGKVVFDSFVARGHEVTFAKNTRLEIELAQR
jgi:hypothetical protein